MNNARTFRYFKMLLEVIGSAVMVDVCYPKTALSPALYHKHGTTGVCFAIFFRRKQARREQA